MSDQGHFCFDSQKCNKDFNLASMASVDFHNVWIFRAIKKGH